MKIFYHSSLDDAVRANMALYNSLKTLKRTKLLWQFGIPVLIFIAVMLLENEPLMLKRLFLAILASVTSAALFALLYPHSMKRQIAKVVSEARGTVDPVEASYELKDDALIYCEKGTCISLDLSTLESIEEKESYIEVRFKPTGVALLFNRIFKDEKEKQEWLKRLNSYSRL
jgi:hypothetical protein